MPTGAQTLYPKQTEVAQIFDVDGATVMRWVKELGAEPERTDAGNLLSPTVVLTLAEQRKLPVFTVAAMLLERADDAEDNADREAVRREVNDFLGAYKRRRDPNRRRTLRQLLDDLRTMLPPRAFAEIEERFLAHGERR